MKQNFWKRAQQFPPVLVRLLARPRYSAPLSTPEIAHLSGLSCYEVEVISQSTDWSCCNMVAMQKFITACGCDWEKPSDLDRMVSYLKSRPTWKYLRVHPAWQDYYQPLLEKFRQHLMSKRK